MEIVDKNHPVLRQKAKDVPVGKIRSPDIKKVLQNMKKALHAEDDGVAIAGPQMGVSKRIFVVSGKVIDIKDRAGLQRLRDEVKTPTPESVGEKKNKFKKTRSKDLIFINPRITKTSKDSALMVEGCLSLRWLYGNVMRKKKVTIEAYNEKGEKITRGASGLLAQIFQHETDHLDGILFIDKAKDVENIPPEEQVKQVAKGLPVKQVGK